MNASFLIEYPKWFILFCLLAGGVYAYLLYGRKAYIFQDKEPRFWKYLLGALRFAAVSILTFLLLSPLIKTKKAEEEKPIVLLLNDNSASLKSSFGPYNREEYLKNLKKLQENIADKYVLAAYNYGDKLTPYQTPDYTEKETDINSAIDEAFSRHAAENIGAVIITGDGIYNKGNSPLYNAKALQVPVYTVALGDTTLKKDAYIKSVRCPDVVYLGDQFSISVQIEAHHLKGQQTNLQIIDFNGSVIASKVISITDDNYIDQIEAVGNAVKPGLLPFKVMLKPMAGEMSTENNYETAYVEVIDGRQKILLLYDAPHPDIKALRYAIEQNKNYQLETADIKTYSGNSKDADMVILHGLPSLGASSKLGLLSEIVNTQVPVFFILSANTNLAQLNTLQKVLQISGSAQNGNEVFPVYNSSFSKFTVNEQMIKTLQNLPPLLAPFGKYIISPTADVFLKQQIGSIPTNNPLLFFNEINGKKSGFLCGEGIWRWRMHEYLQTKSYAATDELINKCIQYLTVKNDKRKFKIRPLKNVYKANEQVEMEAELYNESYELVNDEDVQCVVKGDNGKEFTYALDKTLNAYYLNAGILPVGNYTALAKTNYKGKPLTASCSFSVRAINAELVNTQANHQLLQNLSAQSGGKMYFPQNMSSILEDLKNQAKMKTILFDTFNTRPLIDLKWLFVLALLILALEWFLRKFNGII